MIRYWLILFVLIACGTAGKHDANPAAQGRGSDDAEDFTSEILEHEPTPDGRHSTTPNPVIVRALEECRTTVSQVKAAAKRGPSRKCAATLPEIAEVQSDECQPGKVCLDNANARRMLVNLEVWEAWALAVQECERRQGRAAAPEEWELWNKAMTRQARAMAIYEHELQKEIARNER